MNLTFFHPRWHSTIKYHRKLLFSKPVNLVSCWSWWSAFTKDYNHFERLYLKKSSSITISRIGKEPFLFGKS